MNDTTQLARAPVKPLVWHSYDVWTWWANCLSGTYYVEERNGGWRVQLRVGGLARDVLGTEDTTPADLEAAQTAAEAHYLTVMADALKLDAVAELVEAGTAYKEARMKVDDTPEFCAFVAALAKFTGDAK